MFKIHCSSNPLHSANKIKNITPKPIARANICNTAARWDFSSVSLGSISAAPMYKKFPAIKQFMIFSDFSLRLATAIPMIIPMMQEKFTMPLQNIA